MWVQFLQCREILNRTEYVDPLESRVRRVEEFLDTTLSLLFPRIYSQEFSLANQVFPFLKKTTGDILSFSATF